MSSLSLPWCSLGPFPHILLLDPRERSSALPSPLSLLRKLLGSNEVTPQPPCLQTRQVQSPQTLLTGHDFQLFHQLCCPPWDAFKNFHILLNWWGLELHTELQVRPNQCWPEWDNHLSCPSGSAVFDAPQDDITRKAFPCLHWFICRGSCLGLEAIILFIHGSTEKSSGCIAKGQNLYVPLLGLGFSNLPLSAQSLISPFLTLHHPPVQLQISLPWALCSTHAPILLYLPFTSTRNLYHYDSLCPPPCSFSSLLQTGLLMFKNKSQNIFWMLFHPASKSAIVIEALAFSHHSQHTHPSLRPSWPARVLPRGSCLLSHFIFSRIAPLYLLLKF